MVCRFPLKTTLFPVVSAIFSLGVFNGFAQTSHHIAAANIQVVQNDTGNSTNSVTVSTSLSINDMRIRAGSTRADYNVQIGPVSADDVTNGILIGSIDQNGRDNGEEDIFPGINYGTVAIDSGASGSPGSSGEWWLPVFQVPSGQEYNFNVAAAWFPYSDGWYGGWLNNASGANSGANNQLIGNPNLVLGTHVVDQGGGKTKVDLRAFGLDSRSNAVLLVVGGKNEANYALSATNSDGTWTIFCHDDNKNGGSYEQDYVGFVCVPLTNHAVVSGKLMGDGSVAMSSQMINVAYWGVGTYHLSIPGVDPASGVLIISAEGGVGNNVDNIVSYQISGDGWDIQTRDLTAGATPASQTLDGGTPVASFVFITPTTGQTALRWLGTPTTNWDFSSQVWRAAGGGAPTNYSDGCTAILDDTASSFLVNATTAVAPYPLVVSNNIQDYVLGGVGSITGSGGLIKQGTGKLALALANNYTGDTVISAGTVTVGATGAIPGGAGYGNAVVNGVLDLAGFDCTLNDLSGSGVIDDLSAAGTPHLTIHETGNTTFSGLFKNTTGSLSFRIEGGGSLILRGSSSFSGACTVSNATLVVDGSIGARPVTIQSGGTLAGTGSLSSPVSMEPNSGFRLIANAPLSVGPLTLNGSVNVSMTGVSLTRAATYVLLQHGAISGSGSFQLVMPPGLRANGFTGSLVDTGTQLKLVVSPSGITGTIADVRHVVILMDENRSFDHYFGS
ncbi:MAG TPA: autotransporter-associated beta strand repeat-containing protein, partial [Verrucomicrobiae bacterium]|nr:autotransporter-associated beta strand repeat-containing protein [Verrucomicrobiae bacterium]